MRSQSQPSSPEHRFGVLTELGGGTVGVAGAAGEVDRRGGDAIRPRP